MTQIDMLAHSDLSQDGFVGHVAPQTCWQVLCEVAHSYLIDVRTRAEWAFVGVPSFNGEAFGLTAEAGGGGNRLICAEWQSLPNMAENKDFVAEVSAQIEDKTAPLFFLCRSGMRSQAAARAMTAAGFQACYNVAGGFEGDVDKHGHRGGTNGWKQAGCPWTQQ